MKRDLSEGDLIRIEVSARGKKLRKPVIARVPRAERPGEKAVIKYIIDAFSVKKPDLIKFSLENKSVLKIARHLYINNSGSHQTLYQYVYGLSRICKSIGETPDEIIQRCITSEGIGNQNEIQRLNYQIGEFITDLKADKLAPGTIGNYVKGIKSLFENNGFKLNLSFRFSKRVKYRDRAPTPEELQKIIDMADIRGKVIVSIMALSGMRPGTLVKLQYRHVMRDLENDITPVHLHVEADITKGKYGDYDTFIGHEAVLYLKSYLDTRRRGTRKIPPETITPESPLIRNSRTHDVDPITESQVHRIVNTLYKRAGIIRSSKSRRYEVRPHSIRKYFKTQMTALGTIGSEYIEYMMGHIEDTYNDISSLGIEFLRDLYAKAGLSIRPKTKLNKIKMLKNFAESLGLNPNEVLTREAMSKPYRTIVDPMQREESEIEILSRAIKETVIQELAEIGYNGTRSLVARERFELSSEAPEAPILDR